MALFRPLRKHVCAVLVLVAFVACLTAYLRSRAASFSGVARSKLVSRSLDIGGDSNIAPVHVNPAATRPGLRDVQPALRHPLHHKRQRNQLHRRVGSAGRLGQASFQEYVCKGAKLLQYLEQSAQQVTADLVRIGKLSGGQSSQSAWSTYDDLFRNGWVKNYDNPDLQDELEFDDMVPIGQALTAMGLSTSKMPGGDNTIVGWDHMIDSVIGGRTYWATEAVYTNVFNPRQGVLIASFNYGPQHEIAEFLELRLEHPDIVPPPLKQWSDVAFIEYSTQCTAQNQDVRKIQYIFQVVCQSEKTREVVQTILYPDSHSSTPVEAPEWADRRVFSMDQDEGKAILATPNGNGVAWFLISHKAQLGQKRVKSVTVFRDISASDDDHSGPDLIFEIENVPAGGDVQMGGT